MIDSVNINSMKRDRDIIYIHYSKKVRQQWHLNHVHRQIANYHRQAYIKAAAYEKMKPVSERVHIVREPENGQFLLTIYYRSKLR